MHQIASKKYAVNANACKLLITSKWNAHDLFWFTSLHTTIFINSLGDFFCCNLNLKNFCEKFMAYIVIFRWIDVDGNWRRRRRFASHEVFLWIDVDDNWRRRRRFSSQEPEISDIAWYRKTFLKFLLIAMKFYCNTTFCSNL